MSFSLSLRPAAQILQTLAQVVVVGLTLALVAASLAAAVGLMPWTQIALFFGGQALPQAGM